MAPSSLTAVKQGISRDQKSISKITEFMQTPTVNILAGNGKIMSLYINVGSQRLGLPQRNSFFSGHVKTKRLGAVLWTALSRRRLIFQFWGWTRLWTNQPHGWPRGPSGAAAVSGNRWKARRRGRRLDEDPTWFHTVCDSLWCVTLFHWEQHVSELETNSRRVVPKIKCTDLVIISLGMLRNGHEIPLFKSQ